MLPLVDFKSQYYSFAGKQTALLETEATNSNGEHLSDFGYTKQKIVHSKHIV